MTHMDVWPRRHRQPQRCHGTTWQGQEVRPGQERCPLKRSASVLRPSILEGRPCRDQGPGDKEPFCFC